MKELARTRLLSRGSDSRKRMPRSRGNHVTQALKKQYNTLLAYKLEWHKRMTETKHRPGTFKYVRFTSIVKRTKTGQQLTNLATIEPHSATDDNEQWRLVPSRFLGGSPLRSGPGRSFAISRPVSLLHGNIRVTPPPPPPPPHPRGLRFILLDGSPYWSSPSRSYLLRWPIRISNQSDLSCLSSPNISFNSLFITRCVPK